MTRTPLPAAPRSLKGHRLTITPAVNAKGTEGYVASCSCGKDFLFRVNKENHVETHFPKHLSRVVRDREAEKAAEKAAKAAERAKAKSSSDEAA